MGGQHHAPAALTPGKTWYPLYRRLGGPKGRSGRVRKISPPPGFEPRTVKPVGSRNSDWDTQPAIFVVSLWNNQQMRQRSSRIYWYITNFTPTCFSKSLRSSGGPSYLRSYSSNVCVVDVYGLRFVQCGQCWQHMYCLSSFWGSVTGDFFFVASDNYMCPGSTQPVKTITLILLGVWWPVRMADNPPPSSADVTESGSLNLPEPSGPIGL
jgi:hypothetical protein